MSLFGHDKPGFVPSNPSALQLNSAVSSSSTRLNLRKPQPTFAGLPNVQAPVRVTSSAPTLSTQLFPQTIRSPFACPPSAGGASGTAIVLFRSDLRLDDHPALNQALESASTIVPVFCFDPRHFGRTENGFDKTGKYRARFLIESVQNLRERLKDIGADLVVRIGKPEDVVPDLASRVGASRVFLHREVTYEEQNVERELEKQLKNCGVELSILWSNTLYHCDDLPFSLEDMPDVYSDFREAAEQNGRIRAPIEAPKELPALPTHIKVGDIPDLATLGVSNPIAPHSHGVCSVTGGEKEALKRVNAYVNDSRNLESRTSPGKEAAHIGADFSCRISPWLALGCVSPRRIFKEMSDLSSSPPTLLRSSTYFELVWRDFFRCITSKYSGKRAASVGRKLAPIATSARV